MSQSDPEISHTNPGGPRIISRACCRCHKFSSAPSVPLRVKAPSCRALVPPHTPFVHALTVHPPPQARDLYIPPRGGGGRSGVVSRIPLSILNTCQGLSKVDASGTSRHPDHWCMSSLVGDFRFPQMPRHPHGREGGRDKGGGGGYVEHVRQGNPSLWVLDTEL